MSVAGRWASKATDWKLSNYTTKIACAAISSLLFASCSSLSSIVLISKTSLNWAILQCFGIFPWLRNTWCKLWSFNVKNTIRCNVQRDWQNFLLFISFRRTHSFIQDLASVHNFFAVSKNHNKRYCTVRLIFCTIWHLSSFPSKSQITQ